MYRSLSLLTPLLVLLYGLSPVLHAQSSPRLPGCEVNPAVQNVIDRELNAKQLNKMTFADRFALQRSTLEELISKYPRELEPYTRLRYLFYQYSPDEYAQLRDGWITMGKEHPDDPLELLLASEVLNGVDTPESIRLLQSVRAGAPEFSWAARDLAGIYSEGKLADAAKAKEDINAFFSFCPASSDQYALYVLSNADPSLQPKVTADRAAALRTKLEKETDPKQCRDYGTLWTLEFQMRKPQEYDAERERIVGDLERMEKIHPKGDAEWQAFLISGYKQSGASKKKITALEDRLIAEYPHSNQAYGIVRERWNKAHPGPRTRRTPQRGTNTERNMRRHCRDGFAIIPTTPTCGARLGSRRCRTMIRFRKKAVIAAVDAFLRSVDTYDGPSWQWYYYPQAAQLLIARGLEPDRAIDLVKQTKTNYENNLTLARKSDNLTDEQVKENRDAHRESMQYLNRLMLKAPSKGASRKSRRNCALRWKLRRLRIRSCWRGTGRIAHALRC
jgi:hypothetical protein